jgi:hypothetical protein
VGVGVDVGVGEGVGVGVGVDMIVGAVHRQVWVCVGHTCAFRSGEHALALVCIIHSNFAYHSTSTYGGDNP